MAEYSADPGTVAGIVESLKIVAGEPKAVRASFAKGLCLRGTYTPSEQATQITKSPSFTKPSAVLARFSMGGGNPAVPDSSRLVLRGFAFKLGADDQRSDILTESAPVHFAKTLDQMHAFLKVRHPGPDGKPDAALLKAFSDANPETLHQARYIAARALPGSSRVPSTGACTRFPRPTRRATGASSNSSSYPSTERSR